MAFEFLYSFPSNLFFYIFIIYLFLSLLFLRFPNLIHKKKQTLLCPFHVAHRGGAGEGIENTISTFKKALINGVEMLELDVQLTKDGKVVVLHGENLGEVCDEENHVSNVNFSELPLYRSIVPLAFSKKHFKSLNPVDRKIPLLEEVFQLFPQIPINIDIKSDNQILVDKVYELIIKYKRKKNTIWGGIFSPITKKCLKKDKEIATFFNLREVSLLTLWFYLGILPFLPSPPSSYLEIPFFYARIDDWGMKTNWIVKTFIFLGKHLLMNRFLFRHLQRRGIKIYLWVLNTNREFVKAEKFKVDGYMTDFPSKLKKYLKNKEEFKKKVNSKINYESTDEEIETHAFDDKND